ncbi:MAG: hypothetical protein K0Q77_1970 [Anaerosporomusa subterranea]|jgi:hypothetical protein|nr:hypothetical protein [Anaerosporomusa subterranea]
MTYRDNGSYLGFRKDRKLGKKPSQANVMMDWLIRENRTANHVQDQPAVTSTQNVFDTVD